MVPGVSYLTVCLVSVPCNVSYDNVFCDTSCVCGASCKMPCYLFVLVV